MTKNDIFKKFLQNPEFKEIIEVDYSKLEELDLFSKTENQLLEVVKSVILYTENESSVDLSARRINQLFKKN